VVASVIYSSLELEFFLVQREPVDGRDFSKEFTENS
jgi:hypothetical protein